jgi:ubiquinone/menaquinone biosynthesis C-methylase UbiE
LNEQHFRLERSFGFLINPAIPLDKNKSGIRIADITTGTGIWFTKAARSLPESWQFDGFDMSSAQFPSPLELPSNVSFHEQNALKSFPEK